MEPIRGRRLTFAAGVAALLLGAAPAPPRFVPVPAPSVTVLLFHEVSETPVESTNGGEDTVKKPWLSPAAFDRVLTDAEARGYAFVSLRQSLAYLRGEPGVSMPPKPMLLTFDDGYVNADTGGSPVLRKHHATAVMFFEGRLTGTTPGRLDVGQLRAMQASGVWELQSHGWAGHSNVAVDAAGTRNPYWYANLAWLPALGRRETPDEFEARVRADLTRFRSTFDAALATRIHVFAYPSGEFGQNAALPPGGDPKTRLEAGHSNAPDLTPRLFAAVTAAGYDAAFAVSIPGDVAPASRSNDLLAIPRLGVGADFTVASLDALATDGTPLPEIVAGHFSDPGPIATLPDGGFVVAATAVPELYRLDASGRVIATYAVPALLDDRENRPALISGLVADGTMVTIVQQAGTWPVATPRLTRVELAGGVARVVERRALPPAMNWLVGIAPAKTGVVGMADDGTFFDLGSGKPVGSVAVTDGRSRNSRFTGPLVTPAGTFVFDRSTHVLLAVDPAGVTTPVMPLGGDPVDFAATVDGFVAVDAADRRHLLKRWRSAAP